MKFRTNYDEKVISQGVIFTLPSRTKQSELEASDINNIMARYATTGTITHLASGQPLYGDFSEVEDYQASLNKVMSAEERFMSLPSEIRKKFDYDPQKMVEFILNPDNKEECVKYGFIRPDPVGSVIGNNPVSAPAPAPAPVDVPPPVAGNNEN